MKTSMVSAQPGPVPTADRHLRGPTYSPSTDQELDAARAELLLCRARLEESLQRERRLAQDLHDGVQAQLVLLALDAQALASTADGDLRLRLDQLRDKVDRVAADLRLVVHPEAAPVPFALGDLGASLRRFMADVPLETRLVVDLGGRLLRPEVENALYFVVVEAVTNALKHSGARSLDVHIWSDGTRITGSVRDDGIGGVRKGCGRGLTGIARRVCALQGSHDVDSPSGAGTEVRVSLPL